MRKTPLDNADTLTSTQKTKARTLITSPKHTEIFNIRVKRSQHSRENEGKNNNKNMRKSYVTSGKRNTKPTWDVLDIMKHVRFSFLGTFLENNVDQRKDDAADLADVSKLGKEKLDPGLFSLVKSTLCALLEPPESGFLMVIFGGHLQTVADRNSALTQSIKHVIENTDPNKTLIIVTGPKSEVLSECTLLYDIPLTLRKILQLNGGTGWQFSGPTGT